MDTKGEARLPGISNGSSGFGARFRSCTICTSARSLTSQAVLIAIVDFQHFCAGPIPFLIHYGCFDGVMAGREADRLFIGHEIGMQRGNESIRNFRGHFPADFLHYFAFFIFYQREQRRMKSLFLFGALRRGFQICDGELQTQWSRLQISFSIRKRKALD